MRETCRRVNNLLCGLEVQFRQPWRRSLSWPVSTLGASAIRPHIVRSWPKWKHQIFNALIAVQNFFKSEEESLGGTVKKLFARIAQSICPLALAKICSNTLLFRRLVPSVERI